MANSAIQQQIAFIIKELRNGGKRLAILSKFGKKWQGVGVRTFDRRLREAEKAMASERKHIQKQAEVEVRKEIDQRKLEIMDVVERKAILTQIARGEIPLVKPMVVDKAIQEVDVVPDWTDRKNAIAELNKMDGEYAPTKNANVNPDGSPIEPPKEQTIIIYRDLPPMKKIDN